MDETAFENDPLRKIPSPSVRLWIGLCVILSIFIVFVIFSSRRVRWLEAFQVNVVQKNRKASLQLLRLQNDSYLLGISLRDLALSRNRYPIHEWQPEFNRLQNDMVNAAALEGRYATSTPASRDERVQLRHALAQFGETATTVFTLSQQGKTAEARSMIEGPLETRRAAVSSVVARLLALNDDAQAQAADTITRTYDSARRDLLITTILLFLLALGTGFYTFQASRRTFEKMRDLAEQLHVQSAQLRKLSWKLIDVQEETLRQVARDLHDEFGQILTAIGLMLKRVERTGGRENPALSQELDSAKSVVEETLQKVRDQSQMFHPGVLDDFGIDQALEWFTQQFAKQAGIPVRYHGGVADGLLPSEEAIHLYRIVQEALSNIVRHSRAAQAWVVLEEHDREILLEVRDDGAGFKARERFAGGGIGMMGMRERAEHLNGRLEVRSEPGEGTLIRVRIPMRNEAQAKLAERAG